MKGFFFKSVGVSGGSLGLGKGNSSLNVIESGSSRQSGQEEGSY